MNDQNKLTKQLAEELKESGELGQLLLDNADDAHFFYGMDEKLIYANPAFEKITGYSTQELHKNNLIPCIHPDDQERTMKLWQGLFKGESFEGVEYRIVRKDGETIWCTNSWKFVFDNKGRKIGVQGKLQDITKQKVTEQQLNEVEQHNRNLLEEAGLKQVEDALRAERDKAQRYLETVEAIFVALDINGNITLINRKGCEILGYDEQELLGKSWFDVFIPAGELEDVKQVFNEMIHGNIEPVEYFENAITARNGEEYVIAWHNKILRDDNDNIIGTLGAGNDITKRIHAEEKTLELLQQNRSLTQRLFHIQEEERRDLARDLHDDNSQWLTALRMHAHILSSHCNEASPEIRESIKDIENISSQMQKNIRRMIRNLRAIDLNEIGLKDSLNELINHWQERYPQTHCVLDIQGHFEDLSNTLGVTIYRITQESLTNVAKHAEAKNVTIQLSRNIDQSDSSDVISLRIQDDGKGLDSDDQNNGFGLAGMRERVLAARGDFEFSTAGDKGTIIKVQLPATIKERRRH